MVKVFCDIENNHFLTAHKFIVTDVPTLEEHMKLSEDLYAILEEKTHDFVSSYNNLKVEIENNGQDIKIINNQMEVLSKKYQQLNELQNGLLNFEDTFRKILNEHLATIDNTYSELNLDDFINQTKIMQETYLKFEKNINLEKEVSAKLAGYMQTAEHNCLNIEKIKQNDASISYLYNKIKEQDETISLLETKMQELLNKKNIFQKIINFIKNQMVLVFLNKS